VAFAVAAHLERHLAVEGDFNLLAVEVEHAGARRVTAPDARELRQHLRQAHRREAQLEAARRLAREGEHLETESVAGNGAGGGDAAGPAVDHFAGLDLRADRLSVRAKLSRRRAEVYDLDVRNAALHEVHRDGAPDDGPEVAEAARARDLRPGGLVDEAVHVTDERAVATAGEHRLVPALEHRARDAARVVQGAGVEDVFRRDEVLELAAQVLGNGRRVGVEQDRDAVLSP